MSRRPAWLFLTTVRNRRPSAGIVLPITVSRNPQVRLGRKQRHVLLHRKPRLPAITRFPRLAALAEPGLGRSSPTGFTTTIPIARR